MLCSEVNYVELQRLDKRLDKLDKIYEYLNSKKLQPINH